MAFCTKQAASQGTRGHGNPYCDEMDATRQLRTLHGTEKDHITMHNEAENYG